MAIVNSPISLFSLVRRLHTTICMICKIVCTTQHLYVTIMHGMACKCGLQARCCLGLKCMIWGVPVWHLAWKCSWFFVDAIVCGDVTHSWHRARVHIIMRLFLCKPWFRFLHYIWPPTHIVQWFSNIKDAYAWALTRSTVWQ